MLSGLADENVKSGIVEGLRRRGVDVVTVQELGWNAADDEDLLAEATRQGRLILSCDADFLAIHEAWLTASRSHAGIVYWPQNRSIGDAIRRIFQYVASTANSQGANSVKFL